MENRANNDSTVEMEAEEETYIGGDSAWAQAARNVAIFAERHDWTQALVESYQQWLQGQLALCQSEMRGFLVSIDDELWRREYDTGSDSEEYKLDIDQLAREYAECEQKAEVLKHMIEMLDAPWTRYSEIPREEWSPPRRLQLTASLEATQTTYV